MVKKKTNNQPSTKKVTKEKNVTCHTILKDSIGLPVTENFVADVIVKLKKWVSEEPEAIRINQFCNLIGISRVHFYRLCQKYLNLQEAYDEAKLAMADRLFMGAVFIKKGMRDAPCLRYLHTYDPEFGAADAEAAKIKTPESQAIGIQTVYLEKFPDSPLVPEKKK